MKPVLRATYRLQFHKDFTLYDAVNLVPYLQKMGISHIYASPLLESINGSMHGYDTVSWERIDKDRGGEKGLEALVNALRIHGMGVILDIVPNHMSTNHENLWWNDVVKRGARSKYASYFDIAWDQKENFKINLPFLEKPLSSVLDDKKLFLAYNREQKNFYFSYEDKKFPILWKHINTHFKYHDKTDLSSEHVHSIEDFFSTKHPLHIKELLSKQAYELSWWKLAGDTVNWRRFFDVTSLIALNMDNETVFDHTHAYIFSLFERGLIDGLRIDHIDGLKKPSWYCNKLRERLKAIQKKNSQKLQGEIYIFVEKILNKEEKIPQIWHLDGSTGYDFLEQTSLLFHNPQGEEILTSYWDSIGNSSYNSIQKAARAEKIDTAFNQMYERFSHLLFNALPACGYISKHRVSSILKEILLEFPVYRSYFSDVTRDNQSDIFIDQAFKTVKEHLPEWQHNALEAIKHALTQPVIAGSNLEQAQNIFEALTAPLAAKAGEDTAFYRYNRLLSRNEVGTEPGIFSDTIASFHEANMLRLAAFPYNLLCTATHDHKRGEDGRARLTVLSEPEAAWVPEVEKWFSYHEDFSEKYLSKADQYFIYQTLVASWSFMDLNKTSFSKRLKAYLIKALREAGQTTSWLSPNKNYEQRCLEFVDDLQNSEFMLHLEKYLDHIGPSSTLNSLSQLVLRCTSPGVPDLYQGRESWDFSLVDPDNRRAVDYALLQQSLQSDTSQAELMNSWKDGRIKQWLTQIILNFRKEFTDLFARGDYQPVEVTGTFSNNIVAFSREYDGVKMLVITSRFGFSLGLDHTLRSYSENWNTTELATKGSYKSIFDGKVLSGEQTLCLDNMRGTLPIDVLVKI
ncbi:malto-oligosyltrehalose synthase [Acetobacter cibinongensis]|uniref:1,4-alpha-D-glucan 1-alpha-D-glucosylmutase n=1 Tax=Acetobacter cibinongensis TaxID=146475 RepID=A0A0D6N000_9PROT|nr:malto-oligosyltrehalose synthase [Acetobacter cibinongensis]GAN59065.1 1,4-alpha-D-glucan 1-alpha-D-glucosylmutase [Acetobacter cibinongensis]GBQ19690.1 1,4-alpha-D-glucan 1-alpha-D-glucosylmutase [Acetobacter cibinongensis NRIC 0482]GEL58929.1 malto-oligosyltrehalose synthase [Acetobacter cibinongensis]